jgi:hypothetical protein
MPSSNSIISFCIYLFSFSMFKQSFAVSFPTSAVRIELNTGENIQVFDVKVIDTTGKDIAQGKPAAQSSTSSTRKHFGASLAVDGDPLTYSLTNVTSQADKSVWWEVNLQGEHRVNSVIIKNRCGNTVGDPNECLCRLSNAAVLLLDDAGAAVATQTLGDTCNQHEVELSDFIPNRDPDNYDDDFYISYSPTSFPTLFSTSSPSGAPSTSEQPTLNPTRASKSGNNSDSGLADTPTISIGNNSVTIPISSLFDSQEEELKSLNVESKDGSVVRVGWIPVEH